MKPVEEITVCVCDYGTFLSLAQKLGDTCAKVYYYTPSEDEYLNIRDCCIGEGMPGITRLDDPMDPEIFDTIDLWVFPDIGFTGLQKYLRALGKAVWGSMGHDEYELSRTKFLEAVESVGLPVAPYRVVTGIENLRDYLRTKRDKWIKVNRYRANMETWRHIDYAHSESYLNELAVEFGGEGRYIVFVVQDALPTSKEIGYDGWNIRGQYPPETFQGYEDKNELYLGARMKHAALPAEVRTVLDAWAPLLEDAGYQNFVAFEIRVVDGDPYFIDLTGRMPGQTGEQLLETCANLAEVIWAGAHGIMVPPKFVAEVAAAATIHRTDGGNAWGILRVPAKARRWPKLYHCMSADGYFHFPPRKCTDLGVVLGLGAGIDESAAALAYHLEAFGNEPISYQTDGFYDLVKSIREAEADGMEFGTKLTIPEPSEILETVMQ